MPKLDKQIEVQSDRQTDRKREMDGGPGTNGQTDTDKDRRTDKRKNG